MKMMSFLSKGFLSFVFLAFISSNVFAQSVEQKNDIRNLENEIKANQDNPEYDMDAAKIRLNQMTTDYQDAVDKQKSKPIAKSETQRLNLNTGVSKYDSEEGQEIVRNDIEKYESLLKDAIEAREVALKAGDETTKYDKYISDYNSKLSELRSVLK